MTYEEAKRIGEELLTQSMVGGEDSDEYEEFLCTAIEALQLIDKDGCVGCKYVEISPNEYPCKDCKMSHNDLWSPKR